MIENAVYEMVFSCSDINVLIKKNKTQTSYITTRRVGEIVMSLQLSFICLTNARNYIHFYIKLSLKCLTFYEICLTRQAISHTEYIVNTEIADEIYDNIKSVD